MLQSGVDSPSEGAGRTGVRPLSSPPPNLATVEGWGRRLAGVLCLVALSAGGVAQAADTDEKVVAELWRRHAQPGQPLSAMTTACRRAAAQLQGSTLLPLAPTLEGWYLLRAGDIAAAEGAFARALPATESPVGRMARDMALRWLTRADRARVGDALRAFYRREVRYPDSLAAFESLPPAERPPLVDRWGRPWSYRLRPFRRLAGVSDQAYVLESERLFGDSDLRCAIERPYPLNLPLRARQVLGSAGGKTVFLETTGGRPEKPVLTVGGVYGRYTLVHIGALFLVFGDGDYWYLLPLPGG